MNIRSEIENNDPNLSFSTLAAVDIKETWEYLSERDEDVAVNFIRSIVKVCGTISHNPSMGRDRSDLILRMRQFPFEKYNIFYFQKEDGVEIYRIVHSSRNTVQVFDEPLDEGT